MRLRFCYEGRPSVESIKFEEDSFANEKAKQKVIDSKKES